MAKQPENHKKPLCFVVGPIGEAGSETRKHADMILHAIIKEVLEKDEFGYEVRRADDDDRPGMISDRIIHDIINAELVVADLTELNPNAFYELGIRHAAVKPTVHIVKSGTKLPFDNAGHGAIFVDITNGHDIVQSRSKLSASVKAISQQNYRVSNPITQANATFAMRESADTKDQLLAETISRIAAIEGQIRRPTMLSSNLRKYEKQAYGDIERINTTFRNLVLAGKYSNDQLKSDLFQLASQANLEVKFIEISDEKIKYLIGSYLSVIDRRNFTQATQLQDE